MTFLIILCILEYDNNLVSSNLNKMLVYLREPANTLMSIKEEFNFNYKKVIYLHIQSIHCIIFR